MKAFVKLILATLLVAVFVSSIQAQCETWNNSPRKNEAENAHVIYRPFVKGKQVNDLTKMSEADFNLAMQHWQTAYEIAPAADGQRPFHFIDGRLFYKALREKTEDAAKDKEYAEKIMALYDQEMQCFPESEAYLRGRKGFDMFYMPEYGYRMETFETLKSAVEKGGNNTEYIVFEPLAQVMVYLYQNDKIEKQTVVDLVESIEAIVEYNKENNERYGQYYESALARMNAHLEPIEDEVFDCAYFKKKLLPEYEENPDDLEIIRYVYNKLRQQGCDSMDTDLQGLRAKYEAIATEINTQLEAERRVNNPGYDASQLQREGKYEKAVVRYRKAIEETEDEDARAQFYYSVAFIQTWQFGQYQSARENARQAASLRPGWGKPYILIGDIYAKASRGCGDDWDSRMAILAALEKYAYAKSIDPSVTDEANRKIGIYSSSKPEKQEGFMRGIQAGQTVRVGCWIGETVKVSFQ
jgi:hypothetical protein